MASRIIRTRFKIAGVLTDVVGSVTLSNSGGTYGVKRNDTGATVVAAGTSMSRESTGTYTYTFESLDGVAYSAWVKIVHSGRTYYKEYDFAATTATTGPATPVTSSADAVTRLRQQLGEVILAKTQALAKLSEVLTAGDNPGITYSISGRAGSESVNYTGYLAYLKDQIATFTDLEKQLLEMIQNLQPYQIRQRYRV